MLNLSISFTNCYGISKLVHDFSFASHDRKGRPLDKAHAIYAPNGLMKTSFAKTFAALAVGEQPKEKRFNREAKAEVLWDGAPIQAEQIYVLAAEIDLSINNERVSDLLVNAAQKAEYDTLVEQLEALKSKLVNELQRVSGVKRNDVESQLCADLHTDNDFYIAVKHALVTELTNDYAAFRYADIFEPDALAILQSEAFVEQAEQFTTQYLHLFEQAGSIYKKGAFNPKKAETTLDTLKRQGYFEPGHKVHLADELEPFDLEQLKARLDEVNQSINNNSELQSIQNQLARNAKTQAITQFIENQSAANVDLLLNNVQAVNQQSFKQQLWAYYLQQTPTAQSLIEAWQLIKPQLEQIEQQAAQESFRWLHAIKLFNQRFIDMPFTLAVKNHEDAALGRAAAHLECHFQDDQAVGEPVVKKYQANQIENAHLSQGEKRAFYLLNFIFEVESRKNSQQSTLFVIDDPADSFDYKNKHAILHYLADLTEVDYFYQIILTHNFDFYRSLANAYVNRTRCLMANRTQQGIELGSADAINNIFVQSWKEKAHNNATIFCATIPFARNIIEYTKGEQHEDYLTLTSLLHCKQGSELITVAGYWNIYKATFSDSKPLMLDGRQSVMELIITQAAQAADASTQAGIELAEKVLLSIAIRLKAELYLISALRSHYAEPSYWPAVNSNQFGKLLGEYKKERPTSEALSILEQVSITVSSNIHLNSFMYEPILDLTKEHLVNLYQSIKNLTQS